MQRPELRQAEARFRVDRRAIAGAIAYEALDNIFLSPVFGLTRSAGPGKVHYKEDYFREGDPAAKQVEDRGILPRQTLATRRQLLMTAKGSITYIAAIMSALSVVARKGGGYSLTCDPAALVTLYDGWDLPSATGLFRRKHSPEPMVVNKAGEWVALNLGSLTDAVGEPAKLCKGPPPLNLY